MPETPEFSIRFWGVRGSIAAPGPDTVRYGGNTPCVEVRCGDCLLVIDGGSGLRPLGRKLVADDCETIDLFLTHTHWDHVEGLPFFAPAFRPGTKLRIWAGHLYPEDRIRHICAKMMAPPLFPVPPEVFVADVEYHDFPCGETMYPGDGIVLKTGPLDHPNRAVGYRIEFGGKVYAHVSDTNHRPGETNADVVALMQGADVVTYDAMFTEAEHVSKRDWGHSTWEEAVRLADIADAGTLVLFHHDPARTDVALDEIQRQARAARPDTIVAHEGLVLKP